MFCSRFLGKSKSGLLSYSLHPPISIGEQYSSLVYRPGRKTRLKRKIIQKRHVNNLLFQKQQLEQQRKQQPPPQFRHAINRKLFTGTTSELDKLTSSLIKAQLVPKCYSSEEFEQLLMNLHIISVDPLEKVPGKDKQYSRRSHWYWKTYFESHPFSVESVTGLSEVFTIDLCGVLVNASIPESEKPCYHLALEEFILDIVLAKEGRSDAFYVSLTRLFNERGVPSLSIKVIDAYIVKSQSSSLSSKPTHSSTLITPTKAKNSLFLQPNFPALAYPVLSSCSLPFFLKFERICALFLLKETHVAIGLVDEILDYLDKNEISFSSSGINDLASASALQNEYVFFFEHLIDLLAHSHPQLTVRVYQTMQRQNLIFEGYSFSYGLLSNLIVALSGSLQFFSSPRSRSPHISYEFSQNELSYDSLDSKKLLLSVLSWKKKSSLTFIDFELFDCINAARLSATETTLNDLAAVYEKNVPFETSIEFIDTDNDGIILSLFNVCLIQLFKFGKYEKNLVDGLVRVVQLATLPNHVVLYQIESYFKDHKTSRGPCLHLPVLFSISSQLGMVSEMKRYLAELSLCRPLTIEDYNHVFTCYAQKPKGYLTIKKMMENLEVGGIKANATSKTIYLASLASTKNFPTSFILPKQHLFYQNNEAEFCRVLESLFSDFTLKEIHETCLSKVISILLQVGRLKDIHVIESMYKKEKIFLSLRVVILIGKSHLDNNTNDLFDVYCKQAHHYLNDKLPFSGNGLFNWTRESKSHLALIDYYELISYSHYKAGSLFSLNQLWSSMILENLVVSETILLEIFALQLQKKDFKSVLEFCKSLLMTSFSKVDRVRIKTCLKRPTKSHNDSINENENEKNQSQSKNDCSISPELRSFHLPASPIIFDCFIQALNQNLDRLERLDFFFEFQNFWYFTIKKEFGLIPSQESYYLLLSWWRKYDNDKNFTNELAIPNRLHEDYSVGVEQLTGKWKGKGFKDFRFYNENVVFKSMKHNPQLLVSLMDETFYFHNSSLDTRIVNVFLSGLSERNCHESVVLYAKTIFLQDEGFSSPSTDLNKWPEQMTLSASTDNANSSQVLGQDSLLVSLTSENSAFPSRALSSSSTSLSFSSSVPQSSLISTSTLLQQSLEYFSEIPKDIFTINFQWELEPNDESYGLLVYSNIVLQDRLAVEHLLENAARNYGNTIGYNLKADGVPFSTDTQRKLNSNDIAIFSDHPQLHKKSAPSISQQTILQGKPSSSNQTTDQAEDSLESPSTHPLVLSKTDKETKSSMKKRFKNFLSDELPAIPIYITMMMLKGLSAINDVAKSESIHKQLRHRQKMVLERQRLMGDIDNAHVHANVSTFDSNGDMVDGHRIDLTGPLSFSMSSTNSLEDWLSVDKSYYTGLTNLSQEARPFKDFETYSWSDVILSDAFDKVGNNESINGNQQRDLLSLPSFFDRTSKKSTNDESATAATFKSKLQNEAPKKAASIHSQKFMFKPSGIKKKLSLPLMYLDPHTFQVIISVYSFMKLEPMLNRLLSIIPVNNHLYGQLILAQPHDLHPSKFTKMLLQKLQNECPTMVDIDGFEIFLPMLTHIKHPGLRHYISTTIKKKYPINELSKDYYTSLILSESTASNFKYVMMAFRESYEVDKCSTTGIEAFFKACQKYNRPKEILDTMKWLHPSYFIISKESYLIFFDLLCNNGKLEEAVLWFTEIGNRPVEVPENLLKWPDKDIWLIIETAFRNHGLENSRSIFKYALDYLISFKNTEEWIRDYYLLAANLKDPKMWEKEKILLLNLEEEFYEEGINENSVEVLDKDDKIEGKKNHRLDPKLVLDTNLATDSLTEKDPLLLVLNFK